MTPAVDISFIENGKSSKRKNIEIVYFVERFCESVSSHNFQFVQPKPVENLTHTQNIVNIYFVRMDIRRRMFSE